MKNQKEEIKKIWGLIRKRSVKGNGIHYSLQIYPNSSLVLVGDIERFGKRFAKGIDITQEIERKDTERIKKKFSGLNEVLTNTKKATKKELIRADVYN